MPSLRSSLFPLLLAASSLITGVLAIPAATITPPPPPPTGLARRQVSYNSDATQASLAALSAAQAYSAQLSYSAEAASQSAYYATATGSDAVTDAVAPTQTGPDACGPKIPDPRVVDTCDSFVEEVQAPHPYGVQCLNDGSNPALNVSSCEDLIPIMCTNQFQHAGEWVWASQEGCSLGSFLPPLDMAGAAQWPQQINCEELIYGAMLVACTGGGTPYNVAAVNLQQLPNNTPNGKGAAVNGLYPSYLIAESQPRNLSDNPAEPNTPNPVSLDVESVQSVVGAQYATAFSSESALLATMTGTAAKGALSDLLAYQTAVADPGANVQTGT